MKPLKTRNAMLPPEGVRRHFQSSLPATDMLALQVLFALRAGVQTIENALSRWLGSDALTPGRWQILVVLWASEMPVPQKEIVKALGVSRATVSALVEILVEEGYVVASASPGDKRQVLVTLTPEGRKITGVLVRKNTDRLRQTFGGLNDGELRQLLDLLTRMVK